MVKAKTKKTATFTAASAVALGTLAPMVTATQAYAAETEIPVEVIKVALDKKGLQNDDDILQSQERLTPSITFKPSKVPAEGDYSIITLSDGFQPTTGGTLDAKVGDTVVGKVTQNNKDSWKITYTADASKFDPGSLVINFASSIGPDLADDITFNTELYEVAIGGKGTGESFKIEGRKDVTGDYPVIYSFLNSTTGEDQLGPAFVLYKGSHEGATNELVVSLKPETGRWKFNTELGPENSVAVVKQDTSTVENGAWEEDYAGGYEIIKYTEDEVQIKLTNLNELEGKHVRFQFKNAFGKLTVIDDQNYGLTMNVTKDGVEGKNLYSWTKLQSANASADAKLTPPTASFIAYGNDQAGSGKTADGQDSNANSAEGIATLANKGTNTLVAVNTSKVINENLVFIDADSGKELKRFNNVKPGEKVSFDVADLALKAGKNTFNYKLVAENSNATNLKIELTDPVNYTVYQKQEAGIDVEATIDGQDADTPDTAVTVTPGAQKISGTLTNKSTYTLTHENTTLKYEVSVNGGAQTIEVVNLPDGFSVKPGETVNLADLGLVVEKQGSSVGNLFAETSFTNKLPAVLGGEQVVKASDADAVHAKALTTEIDLVNDQYETELGHDLEFDIKGNDTSSDEAHPIDPSTIKVTGSNLGVVSEDGKTITLEGQWTVTIDENGKGKVTWADGATEKELPVFTYTATNDLGDKTEDATVTLIGFKNSVTLETYLIDENGERVDADTEGEAVKYTSTGVKKGIAVIGNNGDKPLVNPELGFLDEKGGWVSVAVLDGVTIEVGGSYEYNLETLDLPEGKFSQDLVVRANGVEASDPINAVVEVPQPEPTPEPAPAPSEEPAPKKDLVEKPVDKVTKDTNTGANLFEEVPGGSLTVAAGAFFASLGALAVAFRDRLKALFKKN